MKKIALLFLILMSFQVLAQSRKPVKTKEFNLPLNFDVVGHGLDLYPLSLQYDLESTNGEALFLGNIKISTETLQVALLPSARLDSRLTRILPAASVRDWVFLFRWPEHLMQDGVLEAISRTGRVLWSTPIGARERANWQSQQERWRSALLRAKYNPEEVNRLVLFNFQFGLRQVDSTNSPFWDVKEPFRFCFSKQVDLGLTRLCTTPYEILQNQKLIRLSMVPLSEAPPRVILMNEPAKLADEVELKTEEPVQFYAELKSGMSFEFAARPRKTVVVDMVRDANSENAWMTTEGELSPLMESTLLNKETVPEWVEWVGWQQTIGDFRKYWRTRLSMKDTFIMVPGEGGGAFKQKFKIHNLPSEEIRPYVEENTIRGTYIDGAPIRGRKPAQVTVDSKQNSVQVSPDKEKFVWSFGAPYPQQYNRSYLSVSDGENVFQAYHEAFRTYNREISSRLSGILGAEEDWTRPKITIMGEVAFNYWFENFLGSYDKHYHQRWGLSAKAFRSLTNLELSRLNSALAAYTAELKYRLEPGLWARDETWGLLGGYQKVTYDFFDAQMAGLGFFWARSMPKVFDDLIAYLDIWDLFNYPKWVDLEFIYYMVSPDSNIIMAPVGYGNWALNFHGQIMFTPTFFGEAGFGIKQYDFGQGILDRYGRPATKGFSFTSSYGTFGFGFKF